MKRKTFVKCLMSIGVPRNTAQEICTEFINRYHAVRKDGMRLTWAVVLQDCLINRDRMAATFPVSAPVYDHHCELHSYKMWKAYSGEFYWERPVAGRFYPQSGLRCGG